MSLIQRVSSHETVLQERGRAPQATNHRDQRISFSPIPREWRSPSKVARDAPAVGAFEVSKTKRIFQVLAAVLYCLFAAGIVFGYAALKPILIREKVYRNFCTEDELRRDVRICFEQEIHLNLMFTIAAVGTNVAALPIGAILDRFGPRICAIFGNLFLAVGSALFAFAWDLPFDAFIPGYLFLALGGPFIFISSYQLSNTFPKHSGLILALLTGAFDSSSAIFLIYRIVYQWTNYTFRPQKFFLVYLVVPALIFIIQIFLMPSQSYKTVGELLNQAEESESSIPNDRMDETTALLHDGPGDERGQRSTSISDEIDALLGSKKGTKQISQEERKNAISGVWGAMHGRSVKEQLLSPWFILITLFTVIQMTRINFFVATIRPQYEHLLGSYEKAVEINTFFDVALPLGGLISIPFIGMVLDNTSTLFVLTALVATATLIGVLGILPHTWAAYTHVCLFVLYRPFYYTAVSDYAAKVFGFRTFGTVYGMVICLAGLGNFSQSGLDALLHKTFKGDPRPVNGILMGSAFVVGTALVAYVAWRSYCLKRERLEEEAEDAEEVVMPGVDNGWGRS